MQYEMKRLLACVSMALALAACGKAEQAIPTPTAVHTVPPGVIAPVDKARDVVGQLNDQQERTENSYNQP
jgi:hypothetical protein